MSYVDYLNKLDGCIFCNYPEKYIIEKGTHFYIVAANAPYAKDHMLINSFRHFSHFNELTQEEYIELWQLINKVTKFLYTLGHKEVSLFVRDGDAGSSTGKSITHFHYHLLPGVDVRGVGLDRKTRPYYDENKHLEVTNEMKNKREEFYW